MKEKIECVFVGCKQKAIGRCNFCNIPICEVHSKKVGDKYICLTCYKYAKLRSRTTSHVF